MKIKKFFRLSSYINYIKSFFYFRLSYAQEGEDLVLRRFISKDRGFFVDIGAHHPKRFSNTYFFYKKGWAGVNVDALPGSMVIFKKFRPRDINIEAGISNDNKVINFYTFTESAYNTFSKELADSCILQGGVLKEVIELKTIKLSELLDTILPKETAIDFLNIDVEGLDLAVLESNNWDKYKPKYILVESLGFSIEKLNESSVYNFLKDKHYRLVAKTLNTLFFEYAQD